MRSQHEYSRIERERLFFLNQFPVEAPVVRIRHIRDRYIDYSRLRLRRQIDNDGLSVFKLNQKIPSPGYGAQQGLITSMYLTEEEFRILA